tara:strand:- start:3681 stop:4310 length:630 start_codon:yes stop_codon:yes gene_type:complete
MNNLYRYIFLFLLLLISSCNTNTNKTNDINLKIKSFRMNQYSSNGEHLYSINSPESTFNQKAQIYKLDRTIIKFFQKDKITYIINADNSSLLNNKKILKLFGNVTITDNEDSKTIIKAEKFFWDINKSNFVLDGNVVLENKYIYLSSSKAFLNKEADLIEFFNPVKYKYSNIVNREIYNISSENAYYDLKNKTVIFKSNKERVKTKITY